VLECAVIDMPDENQMIKPKAFVIQKKGVTINGHGEQILQEFCRERLAHIKCPRWIEFVDELPKTTTGKIQRFRLRELASR
ncbi:MAG: benzoate-CoA ligase family protein, partial [Pseudorhodoplanes sp.]|nr:benzoate-CoA ligase family protein [Pseudorhodoplanes sp.]